MISVFHIDKTDQLRGQMLLRVEVGAFGSGWTGGCSIHCLFLCMSVNNALFDSVLKKTDSGKNDKIIISEQE